MKRRKFIQQSTLAALASAIPFNGMYASFLYSAPMPLTICDEVNDRVLVILRLGGANDMLNMFVPLNYYGQYSALRPTIKLNNVGQTNGVFMLDSTLPNNAQIGLHPAMVGLKNLYDAGKLKIVNAVGYPNFNYSHFFAESILWAGVDGNNTTNMSNGMLGKYLNRVYPGLSGNPTSLYSDPLAVQFGSPQPILSFVHDNGLKTAEYNAESLMSYFYTQLLNVPIPINSEYFNALDYIEGIENSMDLYYNRVKDCFDNGTNSSVTYPNTYIGKQLKSIARIIKGGSKTKIFQCSMFGFDTHVNQVVNGSAHLGDHATMLTQISEALSAFQSDISNLGISHKILTMSYSEFGRKPMQNGSLGTDHGNISSVFLMGDHIAPGVLGVNANLNNVYPSPDGRYFDSELQHDYRSIYTTLFQDWLGANNSVLTDIGLGTFIPQKLNLVTSTQNANPNCLTDTLVEPCNTYNNILYRNLTLKGVVGNWTYYGFAGQPEYVLGIEKTPMGIGANSTPFDIEIKHGRLECSPANIGCFKVTNLGEATFAGQDFYNTKVISVSQPNGWVNIRWFIPLSMINQLNYAVQGYQTAYNPTYTSPLLWVKKTTSKMMLPVDLLENGTGLENPIEKMLFSGIGAVNNQSYYEFSQINRLHNTGGAVIVRATSSTHSSAIYNQPSPEPQKKGIIRFNTTNSKFELYDGESWIKMNF